VWGSARQSSSHGGCAGSPGSACVYFKSVAAPADGVCVQDVRGLFVVAERDEVAVQEAFAGTMPPRVRMCRRRPRPATARPARRWPRRTPRNRPQALGHWPAPGHRPLAYKACRRTNRSVQHRNRRLSTRRRPSFGARNDGVVRPKGRLVLSVAQAGHAVARPPVCSSTVRNRDPVEPPANSTRPEYEVTMTRSP